MIGSLLAYSLLRCSSFASSRISRKRIALITFMQDPLLTSGSHYHYEADGVRIRG